MDGVGLVYVLRGAGRFGLGGVVGGLLGFWLVGGFVIVACLV